MLTSLFLIILECSLAACIFIACVLVLRAIFRKAPWRMSHLFTPFALGGDDVSGRIKHAVSFRKPKKSYAILCVLLCVALTACLSTNRKASGKETEATTATPKPTQTPGSDNSLSELPSPTPIANSQQAYRRYTGYLDELPEECRAYRIPATDMDDDGLPDRIYRSVTMIQTADTPNPTYQTSLTAEFSSGGKLLLVENDGLYDEYPYLTVCDLDGDGRSDIFFRLLGSGADCEYSRFFPFTRDGQGTWHAMQTLPALKLDVLPASDSEIILSYEGNTVAGPFSIENSYYYKVNNITAMDEWLKEAFFSEYNEVTGETSYFTYVDPITATPSDKKAPDNSVKTVLSCVGSTFGSGLDTRGLPTLHVCWDLTLIRGEWSASAASFETIYGPPQPQEEANTALWEEIPAAYNALRGTNTSHKVAEYKRTDAFTVAILAKGGTYTVKDNNTSKQKEAVLAKTAFSYNPEDKGTVRLREDSAPVLVRLWHDTKQLEILSADEAFLPCQMQLFKNGNEVYAAQIRRTYYGPWESYGCRLLRITANGLEELCLASEGEDRFAFWENRKAELTDEGELVLYTRNAKENAQEALFFDRNLTASGYYPSLGLEIPENYAYTWTETERVSFDRLLSERRLVPVKKTSLLQLSAPELLFRLNDGAGAIFNNTEYRSSTPVTLFESANSGFAIVGRATVGQKEAVLVKALVNNSLYFPATMQSLHLLYYDKATGGVSLPFSVDTTIYSEGRLYGENGAIYLSYAWLKEEQMSYGQRGTYLLTPDGITAVGEPQTLPPTEASRELYELHKVPGGTEGGQQ